MPRPRLVAVLGLCIFSLAAVLPAAAAAPEIVLRTANFKNVHGNWSIGTDDTAADGQYLGSVDSGWSSTTAPLAQPNDYFEATFDAPPATPYHVWVRLRASADSKYNDSVWLQYSDAIKNGSAAYRIGTTSALDVNLERCSGCGVSEWGWQDGAYWLSQASTIQFAGSGPHTLRVQVREDGVQIDQIVLSPAAYLFASPGQFTNDTVIVPASAATTSSAASPTTSGSAATSSTTSASATTSSTGTTAAAMTTAASTTTITSTTTTAAGPYLGSPVSLPGRIEAENFDLGDDGVSYHDTTAGNAGGAYRQTNADIENCSEGGYDVGWIQPGEWANYAVRVGTAGSYTVKLRVASIGGGSLHLGFNGPSNVWQTVSIPNTGAWQSWTTVSVNVTLGAGNQLMTLLYDTAGFNVNYIEVASASSSTSSSTSSGASLSVVTWNINVSDSSASHAKTAIDYIMNMTPMPQIVVIEEAHQSQYNTYIGELQARSGRTWQGVFRTHCPPGAWNGSSCTSSEDEGVGVFTSLSVLGSSTTFLPYADQWHSARALARLAVNAGGVTLQVFGTHLQSNATARNASMSYIKSYASNFSAPQIIAGDFNADMDQIDTTTGMLPNFVDSWKLVGSGNGYTCSTPSPTMKLDYWLADAGGRAHANWSVVVTTPGTFSDHYALINSYTVK